MPDPAAAGDPEPAREANIGDRFRLAFRRHSTTVTVLTYVDASGRACGMTATSVASLSATPPSLIACLNRTSKSRSDILAAAQFGVNVLGLSQQQIAAYCATPGGDKILKESWLLPDADAATPVLQHALAHFDCTIARVYEEYTHSLVVADVQKVWLGSEEMPPLIYSEGSYHTLEGPAEALWERVMSSLL